MDQGELTRQIAFQAGYMKMSLLLNFLGVVKMNVRFLHGQEVEKAFLLIREVFLQTESRGLSQSSWTAS